MFLFRFDFLTGAPVQVWQLCYKFVFLKSLFVSGWMQKLYTLLMFLFENLRTKKISLIMVLWHGAISINQIELNWIEEYTWYKLHTKIASRVSGALRYFGRWKIKHQAYYSLLSMNGWRSASTLSSQRHTASEKSGIRNALAKPHHWQLQKLNTAPGTQGKHPTHFCWKCLSPNTAFQYFLWMHNPAAFIVLGRDLHVLVRDDEELA